MQSFNQRFLATMVSRGTNLCVGLDPDLAKMSMSEGECEYEAKYNLLMKTARETMPFAGAYKPNAAFFEFLSDGGKSLAEEIGWLCFDDAPPILIFDAKRGDIGNTCDQYAQQILERAKYDAVTVNPLMGTDCVLPFLRNPGRGAFVLCLTSNPGAEDFLLKNDMYLRIADFAANKWNGNDNVGLVVGATRPEYAAAIREVAPDLPLLIPGVGAQGGSMSEILDAIDAKNNRRFVINASRSIMFAAGGDDARAVEARRLRDEIANYSL